MFAELQKVNLEHEASSIAHRLYGFNHQPQFNEQELDQAQGFKEEQSDQGLKNQKFFLELRRAQTETFFSWCNQKDENTSSTMCSTNDNNYPENSRKNFQRSTIGFQKYQPPQNLSKQIYSKAECNKKRESRSEAKFRFSDLVNANNKSVYLSREFRDGYHGCGIVLAKEIEYISMVKLGRRTVDMDAFNKNRIILGHFWLVQEACEAEQQNRFALRIGSFKSIVGQKTRGQKSSFNPRLSLSSQAPFCEQESKITPFRRSTINRITRQSSDSELRIVTKTDSSGSRLHQSSFQKQKPTFVGLSQSKSMLRESEKTFSRQDQQRKISQFATEDFETPDNRPAPQNHQQIKRNLAIKFDLFSSSALKRQQEKELLERQRQQSDYDESFFCFDESILRNSCMEEEQSTNNTEAMDFEFQTEFSRTGKKIKSIKPQDNQNVMNDQRFSEFNRASVLSWQFSHEPVFGSRIADEHEPDIEQEEDDDEQGFFCFNK